MDKISIVIVSFNVRYFLRQCLQSVLNSRTEAELEIIVVDNNSVDNSVELLQSEFPQVKYIDNKSNLGFSKANNQAFKIATGDYILILNPDTIIEENCIQICLDYFKSNQNVGAIGIKMVDGSGKYLPESKRGFPTPLRSLLKMSGLSKVFSRSSVFNGYYLGHLSEDETHEIDVLTGAFIFLEKATLDKAHGFDEDYFMYGEDIEMCYQIKKLNKRIIYLPQTSIIHFKGESTQKSSLNYLKRFYGAMQTYSIKRHSNSSFVWNLILQIGILSAGIAGFFKTCLDMFFWPVFNFLILFTLSKGIQWTWANLYYNNPDYYENANSNLSIAILCFCLVACFYILGHFDRKYSKKQWIYASSISALVLLALYGLFPLEWRFSRSILLFLILTAPFVLYCLRCVYNRLNLGNFSFDGVSDKRILIIGTQSSFDEVSSIINYYYKDLSFLARVYSDGIGNGDSISYLLDLPALVKAKKVNELIFCSRDILAKDIFNTIAKLDKSIYFKIASNDNNSILGSSSKNTLGEWFTTDIEFKVSQDFHKRTKRIIDLFAAIVLIPFSIIVVLFSQQWKVIYAQWFNVVIGNKTWISYNMNDKNIEQLPFLKQGVFSFKSFDTKQANPEKHRLNLFYARNYSIWMELDQLLKQVFTR